MQVDTVKIKVDNVRGYRIINLSSFDASKHTLFEDAAPASDQAPVAPVAPVNDGYEDMTLAEIRALADKQGVDLGDATRKSDVIAKMRAAKA